MAEDLQLLAPYGLVAPSRELQERFLGVPFSQVLDEAVEVLGGAVNQKIGNEAFLVLANEHMERFSQYLQYLIGQSQAGDRSIRFGAGKQEWPPHNRDRIDVAITHESRRPEDGENISYRGTVQKRGYTLHPVTADLFVDVPDHLGRYTRRYEFTNHVYMNTGQPHYHLQRILIYHVDDVYDSAAKSITDSISWTDEIPKG